MRIRPYDPKDSQALADLFRYSVERIGPKHYAPEQVAAWAGRGPSPKEIHRRATDGRTLLVAVDSTDRPLAFGDLEEDGHIDFLYCTPEVVGKGVAAALYSELERIARERGLTRLTAEASEAARRFFVKRGFTVTARREFEVSDVAIHNYAVEKDL